MSSVPSGHMIQVPLVDKVHPTPAHVCVGGEGVKV